MSPNSKQDESYRRMTRGAAKIAKVRLPEYQDSSMVTWTWCLLCKGSKRHGFYTKSSLLRHYVKQHEERIFSTYLHLLIWGWICIYIRWEQSIHQGFINDVMSNPAPVGFLFRYAAQVDEGVACQRLLLLLLQFLRLRSDRTPGIRLSYFTSSAN